MVGNNVGKTSRSISSPSRYEKIPIDHPCEYTETRAGKPLKRLPQEISTTAATSAADLYSQLALRSSTSVHQLRVTKGSDGTLIPNARDIPIEQTGLRDQSIVYVKDLGIAVTTYNPPNLYTYSLQEGPQIAWRTVFIIEYLGPIIIHPLLYTVLPSPEPSTLQALSCALVTLHFVKREFETMFLHRFSAATMPAWNIFRNSAHYWLLAGVNMAYWCYCPGSSTTRPLDPLLIYPSLLLYAIGELGNLSTHITLRNLRSSGGKERGIPQGLGFNICTCPNYMFEIIAWVGILLVTRSLSTLLFLTVAVGYMGAWAKGKERRYRREFGDKYKKKRWVMLPGLW